MVLESHGDSRILLKCLGLSGQRFEDFVQCAVCDGVHFVVRTVLDRMLDEDTGWAAAEGLGLGFGGADEFGRSDEDGGQPEAFEGGRVVHTARRTRPSIGQGFDHPVAAFGDPLAQVEGGHAGEGGLAEALDLRTLVDQELFEAVEEDITARLGDIE